MLRTFRSLRLGQIALAIASVLEVTGSLGLHPEPPPSAALARQAPDGLPQFDGPRGPDTASHDCLACLAHSSLSIPRLSGVVLEPVTVVALSVCTRNERPLPAPGRAHAGRAPPASA